MKKPLKERVYAYNRARAADTGKANDLMTLLNALPPGQLKQLLKDKTCGAILKKYGIYGRADTESKSTDGEVQA